MNILSLSVPLVPAILLFKKKYTSFSVATRFRIGLRWALPHPSEEIVAPKFA